ncbi:MAG: ribbon-helix-helix protein, CopG family [Acutalibacteraceae bacterium]
MFSIRVDKSIVDYYDKLASETNRSRNEIIAMALEFAMGRIETN